MSICPQVRTMKTCPLLQCLNLPPRSPKSFRQVKAAVLMLMSAFVTEGYRLISSLVPWNTNTTNFIFYLILHVSSQGPTLLFWNCWWRFSSTKCSYNLVFIIISNITYMYFSCIMMSIISFSNFQYLLVVRFHLLYQWH